MIDTDSIVTFGDSWPAGVGIRTTIPYGQLLCSKLRLPNFYNKAVQGSSIDHLLLQLFEYIAQHKTVKNHIAIFFMTTPGRSMHINHSNTVIHINMSPTNTPKKHTDLSEIYYKYFYSHPGQQFNLNRTVLALHQVCNKAHMQDFYINGWMDNNFDCVGIDTQKIYPKTCAQILGYVNQDEFLNDSMTQYHNQYMQACGHPNQEGHQLIADSLYNWIKTKIV